MAPKENLAQKLLFMFNKLMPHFDAQALPHEEGKMSDRIPL